VTGIYEEELRPLRLKASQMVILVVTARLGQVRATELSRILHVDASTLSRNVERMRARGWLQEARADDVRSRPFQVSASGKEILGQAVIAWERAQAKAVALLGKEGVADLHRLSEKVNARASGE
jgi:DNA-binding MarR family transcriptional regulator